MDIFKISAVGIITALCVMILKDTRNDIAILIGITGSCIMLLSIIDYISDIFSVFSAMIQKTGINPTIFKTVGKIVGIGYITDFSAGIIEDTGAKGLSDKVILSGKILIMVLALPIITSLFDMIAGILQ